MGKFSKLFFVFVFIFFAFYNGIVFGKDKYRIVLFYADWNVYSNNAIYAMQKVSKLSNGLFTLQKINIDDEQTCIDIKLLGLKPNNTIPYYFVLDKNDKILYETKFIDESPGELLSTIKKNLNN